MNYLIETERLAMRRFTLVVSRAVLGFSTHPEVTRYTGDAGWVTDLASAEALIQTIWLTEYERYGYARYALIYKAENRVIGFAGLKYEPEFEGPDLGYRMLPEYWGLGLGFEAAQAALRHGVDELKLGHIQALAVKENIASNRIIQRLGFSLRGERTFDGFIVNHYDYWADGVAPSPK